MTAFDTRPDTRIPADGNPAQLREAYDVAADRAERIASGRGIREALIGGTVTMTGPMVATAYGWHGWPFVIPPLAFLAFALAQTIRLNNAEETARARWQDYVRAANMATYRPER